MHAYTNILRGGRGGGGGHPSICATSAFAPPHHTTGSGAESSMRAMQLWQQTVKAQPLPLDSLAPGPPTRPHPHPRGPLMGVRGTRTSIPPTPLSQDPGPGPPCRYSRYSLAPAPGLPGPLAPLPVPSRYSCYSPHPPLALRTPCTRPPCRYSRYSPPDRTFRASRCSSPSLDLANGQGRSSSRCSPPLPHGSGAPRAPYRTLQRPACR